MILHMEENFPLSIISKYCKIIDFSNMTCHNYVRHKQQWTSQWLLTAICIFPNSMLHPQTDITKKHEWLQHIYINTCIHTHINLCAQWPNLRSQVENTIGVCVSTNVHQPKTKKNQLCKLLRSVLPKPG